MNKEIQRVYQARYNASEKGKATRARYAESHQDQAIQSQKKYNNSEKGHTNRYEYIHSDRSKAIRNAYLNSEKGKIATRKYRNSDKCAITLAAYEKSENGKRKHIRANHARRARKRGIFTLRKPGDFAEILLRFGNACAYCKKDNKKLEEDHQIPISWGGDDALWNIVPACKPCNRSKGARFWGIC